MEEATSNDDSDLPPLTHSILFHAKTLVTDEMDFFADNNNKNKNNTNVFPDDHEMLHQMELHVDVRDSFNRFFSFSI